MVKSTSSSTSSSTASGRALSGSADPATLGGFYAATDEDARLRTGLGRLEYARVQEIVRRHLPRQSGLDVLDVGGATGVHAEWLLADGHRVRLVDLMPRHVARALDRLGDDPGFSAAVGDARQLACPDASADVVLLLGPLYHLPVVEDRRDVWSEAARVVRPGGVVVGMAISRFSSLLDGLAQGYLFDARFREIMRSDLSTGRHENTTDDPRYFTTGHFHHPDELPAEARTAGLDVVETVAVEGPVHWFRHLWDRWDDEDDRAVLLETARSAEHEPTLLGASPHLVTIARRT